jgi:hypothetical protein
MWGSWFLPSRLEGELEVRLLIGVVAQIKCLPGICGWWGVLLPLQPDLTNRWGSSLRSRFLWGWPATSIGRGAGGRIGTAPLVVLSGGTSVNKGGGLRKLRKASNVAGDDDIPSCRSLPWKRGHDPILLLIAFSSVLLMLFWR